MEANRQKTIDGLKEVLIYLAICCYSPETEQQEKVRRMGQSINDAMELLKGDQDGTMG